MALVDYTHFLGVKAFTSDRSVDFFKDFNDGFQLNEAQRLSLLAGGILSADKVIFPKQVHGDVIWKVSAEDVSRRGVFEADAVVTHVTGLPIAVRTADCLPLLMADPVKKVVAVVHAGWKSSFLKIAAKTVAVMVKEYGSTPSDIRAAIGPCIRRVSYQVGEEFKTYFPDDVYPEKDGLHLDLSSANKRQLTAAGIMPAHILDDGLCTVMDKDRFFSFRREAEGSGRLLSVIVM